MLLLPLEWFYIDTSLFHSAVPTTITVMLASRLETIVKFGFDDDSRYPRRIALFRLFFYDLIALLCVQRIILVSVQFQNKASQTLLMLSLCETENA